jgi:hypothetical protein
VGTKEGTTLDELVARLQELERELITLRAAHAASATQPENDPSPIHAVVPQTRSSRRQMLRTALGATAATVAAGAAGLSLESGTASANTGGNMILGQTNLANSGTQVKWNGSSGFTGVILLGNDTGFSDAGAFFPAACGGWAGGGAAGVPHGVYGFTQVAPTVSLTPVGVAGLATLGTGVHGETQSASVASIGVEGVSPHGIGVSGTSTNGTGVSGTGGSTSPGTGVAGTGNTGLRGTGVTTGVAATATSPGGVGVSASGPSIGVAGQSTSTGVQGLAFGTAGTGVAGNSSGAGGRGVLGISGNAGDGVLGRSTNPTLPGNGVHATAAGVNPTTGAFGAVFAEGGTFTGVHATSTTGIGVRGISTRGTGVTGTSSTGRGGVFTGGPAAIQLTPSTASTHPASGQAGDLFVDAGHNLWFCKGGSIWVKLA